MGNDSNFSKSYLCANIENIDILEMGRSVQIISKAIIIWQLLAEWGYNNIF